MDRPSRSSRPPRRTPLAVIRRRVAHPCLRALGRLVAAGPVAGVMCGAASWPELHAQDRMVRRHAAGQGFSGAPVAALNQDARGFLWIGGEDGLYRYDGTEFRRWAGETIEGPVRAIATTAAGDLVAMNARGVVYAVVADGAHAIDVPLPPGPGEPNSIAFDTRGRLWIVRGGRIGLRESSERWHLLPDDAFGGEAPHFVRASAAGNVAVATSMGVWLLDSLLRPHKRIDGRGAADVIFLADGGIAAIDDAIRVERDGQLRVVDPFRGDIVRPRAIALAERDGTLWAAYDRFLVALRPDRPPEVMGAQHGVESGGPLLVDHEGSLWMGTFTSLLQYPEPETRIWNERSGLLSQHTRFVVRSSGAVWVTTWQGTAVLRPDRGEVHWPWAWFSQGEVCDDARGGVWLATRGGVFRAVGEDVLAHHPAPTQGIMRCAGNPDGGAWLAMGEHLFHGDSAGLRPVLAPALPAGARAMSSLHHGAESELWIGGDGTVCRGSIAAPVTIDRWDCSSLPGAGNVLAFYETPSGNVWAATSRGGVMMLRDGTWAPAPGNAALPSRALLNLIPSPAGGVWILGHGVVWRAEETDPDGSWAVRERLGEWHGLPLESGRDLHEDADGRLWITTSLGVIEVAASARTPIESRPQVELVAALVDDDFLAIDGNLELPADRNRLELRFAVLSFRDPGRLRYQVRLSPTDDWRLTTGRPWFRWIDMPPREHRAEVRASLDGVRWTPVPASLTFRVRPPWYRTAWARGGLALAGLLLLWTAYRARVRYLLGLERERTRIAMDLHDEMGSQLGSIGILSGLLASRGTDDGHSRDLARRIASTAQDLGGALSGIIWSLDARPSTLAELASRLAEGGVNLLGAQDIAFRAEFPEAWPPDPLSPRARRNLMLLGLEALHNAARHARARSVTLGFRRVAGRWEMRVADDGVGFEAAGLRRGGHGLVTMRRRAEEIGASIDWKSGAGEGVAVVVRFSIGAVRMRGPVPRAAYRTPSSGRRAAARAAPARDAPVRDGGAA